jgi:amidase
MADFTLRKEQNATSFDRSIAPVLEVDPGATVTFETGDVAYERLSKGETVEAIGLENFNRVTGPVYVRGAEPGDAICIDVLDVRVTRAWSVWLPQFGGLGAYTGELRVMETPLANGSARMSDRIAVPIKPMIGCIGLAPAEGKGSTFMPAYPWGGNMDLREMSPGAILYLPVQVSGGLLAMGDLHAAMGVGEPTWVSLEASGQATLRINLEKNMRLKFPRLRVGGSTLCLGMGETLAAAYQAALDEVWSLLINEWKLEGMEAYAYASACVDMRFGGPANPIVIAAVPDLS